MFIQYYLTLGIVCVAAILDNRAAVVLTDPTGIVSSPPDRRDVSASSTLTDPALNTLISLVTSPGSLNDAVRSVQATTSSCTPKTACMDYMNNCGVRYGG